MKKAIKFFTLLLTLALVASMIAVVVSADTSCETEEVNVAGEATLSGVSARWSESYFRQFINDGDPLTGSPANMVDWGDAYDTVFSFSTPYKFSKIVIQTYGVGRIEAEYSISQWVSGKTSVYNIDVYLYDEEGSEIHHATVTAGGKDDLVIELPDNLGYASSIGVFYERNGEPQCIWEFEAYTKEIHNWEQTAVKTPATCTNNGVATMRCSGCKEEADVTLYATGHDACGACTVEGCAEGTAETHTCVTNCLNGCGTELAPAHVKNPDDPCDPDCYNCDAEDVFTITHRADTTSPCSTTCYYCGEEGVATPAHVADKTNPCNNDCAVCGAKDVIPDAYDFGPEITKTNLVLPYTYVSHVANPNDPCDTTCYECGKPEAVRAAHVPDPENPCTVTICYKCKADGVFAHYALSSSTIIYAPHVRPETIYGEKNTTTNAYTCRLNCLNKCSGYTLSYAHEFDNCGDKTCNICLSEISTSERDHSFTADSPFSCVDCGYTRGSAQCVEHVYTNRCDQVCNVCGTQGAKSFFGSSGSVPEFWHVYDNSCDTTCNECNAEREIQHTYPNADCARFCTVCGYERPATGVAHTYSDLLDANNAPIAGTAATCDTICDACNEKREVTHVFAYACAPVCARCGATNANASSLHTWDNSCDTSCNTLGCTETRQPEHVWSAICDPDCNNNCGYTREVEHIWDNNCDTACNRNCGYTRAITHVYDNACDATCNATGCDYVRTAETDNTFIANHSYDNACDADCNVCGATRTPADHAYDNACDTTCNSCNATRTVGAHVYGDDWTETEDGFKEYTCTICGAKNKTGDKAGLGGGAIAVIIAGAVALVGGGGFLLYWFVFRKRSI